MSSKHNPWPAIVVAVSELGLVTLPLGVWLFWLYFNSQIHNLLIKPEISFISLILSAEAMRTANRYRDDTPSNPDAKDANIIFWAIGLIFCALFLGFDIAQYEGQAVSPSSISLIQAVKIPVLIAASIAFLWSKYLLVTAGIGTRKKRYTALKKLKYDTRHSRMFYSETAGSYDSRNSAELRQIQLEIVHHIRGIRDRLPAHELSVLDLGSGTGRLIAEHFYSQEKIRWTAIDNCHAMVTQFRNNFERARMTLRCLEGDLLDEEFMQKSVDGNKYHAIVLCYTLSSVPLNPAWDKIAQLLDTDGEILIAEADKSFLSSLPTFDINVDEVEYQLELRSVDALQLKAELEAIGLEVQIMPTMRADKRYGYLMRGSFPCKSSELERI